MFDRPSNGLDVVRQQSFSVAYDYTVAFTPAAREIAFCARELDG